MANFLKKLQSLVSSGGDKPQVDTAAPTPPKEAAPAKKTAPVEKQTAERSEEAVPRAKESTPAVKEEKSKLVVAVPSPASVPPAAKPAEAEAPKKRQPLDPERINLADAWEVRYRRKQFGCTELQLRQAVAAVGDSVAKVKLQLRSKSVPPKGGKQRYE